MWVLRMADSNKIFTAAAGSNIAFIKYWGRRDDALNLPANSSISMTLDSAVSTRTSVAFSRKLDRDRLYINGEEEQLDGSANEKTVFMKRILDHVRSVAKAKEHVLIVSENSFPSSAGMASSASGAAALVTALDAALGMGMDERGKSILTRQISGSACRSVQGGFVKWNRGVEKDGADSYAVQVADERHWPELMDIIAVVDASKKRVSSSEGHSSTPKTSPLYAARPAFAERGVGVVEKALVARDFQTLAEAIMRDSNNMHATMLDTWKPIMYLNDKSREIMYAVEDLNSRKRGYVAAYTFDAGPNAHLITTREHRKEVLGAIDAVSGISRVIESGVGAGPELLGEAEALIDAAGLGPKRPPRKA